MMDPKTPWRVGVLGWGNRLLGVVVPFSAAINTLAALQVFSVEWAGQSIVLTAILGAVLGYLHWSSGSAILRQLPGAFERTCVAGGVTFGYAVVGILTMATSGRDRALLILIRHGSENWWDWSLSYFQNSALREIPLMAWWVLGLGTISRYRLRGAPERLRDRLALVLCWGFYLAVIGALVRSVHFECDLMLHSQR